MINIGATELLIFILIINTLSNMYAGWMIMKFGRGAETSNPEMAEVYQKQLKNYQSIIRLNEKLIKSAMDTAQQEPETKPETKTEERRVY